MKCEIVKNINMVGNAIYVTNSEVKKEETQRQIILSCSKRLRALKLLCRVLFVVAFACYCVPLLLSFLLHFLLFFLKISLLVSLVFLFLHSYLLYSQARGRQGSGLG